MDETTTTTTTSNNHHLFSDVKFAIAECQDEDTTKNLLIDNGAKHINYLSDNVTLVISDFTCLEADQAMSIFEKPIVSSLWVHLSLKANRLLPPEAFCPYKNIFHDVIASFSSGLTQKDRNVLACTLTYYGARVSKHIADCTHFIVPKSDAEDRPSDTSNGVKFVTPDWVTESAKQNSCCNEESFEPSLLLPPPPPRPPTPPPAPPPPVQVTEPAKLDVSPDSVAENNSDQRNQQPKVEYVGNPQQYQPQFQARPRQPHMPGPQQAQRRPNVQSPLQHPPPQQYHVTGQDRMRPDVQSHPNSQPQQQPQIIQQTRPIHSPQRPPQPQMQSQVSTRFQSHPQVRLQSPHTQQKQHNLQQQQHPQHPHHQQPQPHQQHSHNQHQPHQQQHYQQHPHQHQPHQQHQLGHPSQVVMQVRPQSQPGTSHRMIRPQSVTPNHMIDQKQNNVRPVPSPQIATIRHQQSDQVSYDNFDQSNHRRPEYAGTPPQYQPQTQPHPRIRQPYSPMPQQNQVHQVQSPMHHATLPPKHQHQLVSPDRIQPEMQSQPNLQQPPQISPQARPVSNMQHHPHSQMQSQTPHQQMQPLAQHHQNPQIQHHHQHQHQHQHGHPTQAVMQLRPQSQPGMTHQVIRAQSHGPNHQIDLKQSGMPTMQSPQMANMRHSQPEQVSYESFNQSKFTNDPQQYQQHPRLAQPYQHPSQQSPQAHRIQSPIHHPPQQHQHVSPDRIQSPHHSLQQQSHHLPQNQSHQHQHGSPSQSTMQLRPQLQPGTSHQIVKSLSATNQIDQKQNNIRSTHSQQVVNSPRMLHPEENIQPQPHPSIFDHSRESNLSQIKSKVPVVQESVQYFGHDPRQNVPKNQPLFGCKLKLVEYKSIDPGLKEAWSRAIMDAGGTYCDDLNEATHLICETRKCLEYSRAVEIGLRCVTIYWINDILTFNRLTHPWKALHIPCAYSANERPLGDHIISVTNIRGRDRREVKEMILRTGAKFTDYFSAKNTLIICGTIGGDKYDRAVEWKIPIANCQLLSDIILFGTENIGHLLAQSKYQIFGQKDPFKLTSHPKIREFLQSWTRPLPLLEPGAPLDAPTINGNSKNLCFIDSGDHAKTGPEPVNDQNCIKINGIEPNIAIKSESNQSDRPDLPSQPHQVSDVIDELVASGESTEMNVDPKHSDTLQGGDNQKLDEKENTITPVRHFRKSKEPISLMYTNVGSDLIEPIKEAAAKFGLPFASNHKDCTHLLVGQLCRTSKFICAFNHANFILNPSWLLESSAAGEILEEKPFIVQDKESEEKYSFNLVHSLVKRKRRSQLLFNNWVFFITPSVRKDVPDIEVMIESAGGCVCSRKPPSKRQIEQLKSEGKRMIVVTCDEDHYLCSSLETYGTEVVNPEFVISGILRQDIDIDVHRIRKKQRLDYS